MQRLIKMQYLCLLVTALLGLLVSIQTKTKALSAAATQTDQHQDSDQGSSENNAAEDFDRQIQLDTFDYFWTAVANSHWDEELIEQKWLPLKEPNRQKVEQAQNVAEVRKILRDMIDQLGLSHYSIIDNSAYSSLKELEEIGDGTAGMEFRVVPEGFAVWRVRPDFPAAAAGVEAGWLIKQIGNRKTGDLIEDLKKAAKGPTRYETLAGLLLSELATGQPGIPKKFLFVDRDGKDRELELDFVIAPGETTTFGNLPPMKIETVVETLPGGIGYFWFNAFFNPVKVMPEFRETIRDPNHSQGIIIDLRSNIGGIGAMTMGMASEFSNQQTALGVMHMKGNELKFFVNANIDPVQGPLAVLVDECSISSAEILSGGLQDLHLARIFGNRTAGLALPSTIVKLPNGDGFQYAVANYISASGKTLEMDGVMPDEVIPLNRNLLLEDPDPVLTRAMAWIKQQNAKEKPDNGGNLP